MSNLLLIIIIIIIIINCNFTETVEKFINSYKKQFNNMKECKYENNQCKLGCPPNSEHREKCLNTCKIRNDICNNSFEGFINLNKRFENVDHTKEAEQMCKTRCNPTNERCYINCESTHYF